MPEDVCPATSSSDLYYDYMFFSPACCTGLMNKGTGHTWTHQLQGVMADLQCAANVPLSGSGEEQEIVHVLPLTQLVIAELNGEHATALRRQRRFTMQCFDCFYRVNYSKEATNLL